MLFGELQVPRSGPYIVYRNQMRFSAKRMIFAQQDAIEVAQPQQQYLFLRENKILRIHKVIDWLKGAQPGPRGRRPPPTHLHPPSNFN